MWLERSGLKNRGHRPDLIGYLTEIPIPSEVELAAKSRRRLDAIVGLHRDWMIADRTGGFVTFPGSTQQEFRAQLGSRL